VTQPPVVVANLSKKFRRYHPDRPSTIQEAVARGLRWTRSFEDWWALRDVSFRVDAAKTVGIIGANGSGKSTLLRLIGGVGRPDGGRVDVRGRIGALLDLGAGFHPDLTGRENAVLAGLLSGLTRREVCARLNAIMEFAEVASVIDHPIRTYSTGMQMRLAFATAVHAEPEILLIDEVLSVGDLAFQNKCLERIARFRNSGCSILLVSHESSVIQEMCDEALWLNKGRLMAHGTATDVVAQYVEFMEGRGAQALQEGAGTGVTSSSPTTVRTEEGLELVVDPQRFGSLEVELTNVRLLDSDGKVVSELRACQPLRIEIEYRAAMRVVAPIFCVRIAREDGLVCYIPTTEFSNLSLTAIEGTGRAILDLERLDLNSGHYVVDASCYSQDWAYAYDYHFRVASLMVRGDGTEDAVCNSPFRWEIHSDAAATVVNTVSTTPALPVLHDRVDNRERG
jgi:lipopolysaccharide transport system ATP-binding protein